MLVATICVALLALTTADCPDADIECKMNGNVVQVITLGQCYDLLQGKQPAFDPARCLRMAELAMLALWILRIRSRNTGAWKVRVWSKSCHQLVVIGPAGGCQPEHCDGNSPGKRCNERVSDCNSQCTGTKVSG